ncbi:hypothetical protein Mp_8g07010 [Marchantia polymorpha subsp. ruderalis]|nr:hypothetical protein Mp_8g07010 [Marchantia polymorpha subsp. ruderalis]
MWRSQSGKIDELVRFVDHGRGDEEEKEEEEEEEVGGEDRSDIVGREGGGKGREGDSRGQGEAAACPRQTATNRSSGRELKLTNKGESGAGPLPGRSCARTERGEGRCRAERVQPTVAQCAAIVTACALSRVHDCRCPH